MSPNSVPVCSGCSKPAKVSINCTKCGHICCLSCFDSISTNNSSNDSADGDYVKLSEWVCNKCATAGIKDDEKEEPASEQVSDQKDPTSETSSVAKEESSTEPMSIEEDLPTESKLGRLPSALKEPTAEPMTCSEQHSMESVTISLEEVSNERANEPSSDLQEPTAESAESTTNESLSKSKEPTAEPMANVDQNSTEQVPTPSPTQKDAPTDEVEPKQDRCGLHGREWKFYCLTCDALICENCFLIETSHMRHQIDLIEAVYRERRAKTEQKQKQLEEKVKAVQENAVQIDKNLEILEEVKRSVYDEIDSVCTKAKKSVAMLTDNKKQRLQRQAEFPVKAQELVDSLQELIQQLPQSDFLQQQSQLDKQYDEMLDDSVPRNFVIERFEDIGCELVPPYEMRKLCLENYATTSAWPQHEIVFCETRWTVCLFKKDSLFMKLTPQEKDVLQFPFKLLVEIVHRELQKTIRKTFTIHGSSEDIEIVSNNQLETERLIEENKLVVEIGLRPRNVLIEKRLLKQETTTMLATMKKTLDTVVKHVKPNIKDFDSVLVSNEVYSMHYFNVNLYKQTNDKSSVSSTNLTDHTDRQWYLQVYPLDKETKLKAFVVFHKGTPTKCRFFIELLNTDPTKTIKKFAEYKFDKNGLDYGWHWFIDRQELLSDPGFYPNDTLYFRFGVLPIAD